MASGAGIPVLREGHSSGGNMQRVTGRAGKEEGGVCEKMHSSS